jgi:hypothetical protein
MTTSSQPACPHCDTDDSFADISDGSIIIGYCPACETSYTIMADDPGMAR